MASNRQEVLDDLAAAELRFVKALRLVSSAFLDPLEASRLLAPEEFAAIVRNLRLLRENHGKVLHVLQVAAESDSPARAVQTVAQWFTSSLDFFRSTYVPFLASRLGARHALQTAAARPDVAALLRRIYAEDERVRGHSLEQLLELPIAHFVALRDGFQQLAALTPSSDPALEAIARLADAFSAILRDGGVASSGSGEVEPAVVATVPTTTAAAPAVTPSSSTSSSSPARVTAESLRTAAQAAFRSPHPSLTAGPSAATAEAATQRTLPPAPAFTPGESGGVRVSSADGSGGVGVVSEDVVRRAREEAEGLDATLQVLEQDTARAQTQLASVRPPSAGAAPPGGATTGDKGSMQDALRELEAEETSLYERVAASEHRDLFESFLAKKRELEEEEARLLHALEEHEETLAQLRARLAHPPASVLPSDPVKAQLYLQWKRALAEREDLLRQARARKHELLRDLKARHETQVVLLELERRAAVDGLRAAVDAERAKADAYRRDLAALEGNIESARDAMKRFREEFEQLRVALLIDRMAKSSQIASLAERRRRLAAEAEEFKTAVEAARQRVAAEEASRWEARLAAEKEAGERRLGEEKAKSEDRVRQVRDAMARDFEKGFRPLLEEAEKRHEAELRRGADLQRQLEQKEDELRRAHEAARKVAALTQDELDAEADEGSGGSGGGGTPEWKLREFEDLKRAVATMWDQLEIPEEDITAFLSECDLLAPYHPKALELYQEMHKRLSENDPVLVGGAEGEGVAPASSPPLPATSASSATSPTTSPSAHHATAAPAPASAADRRAALLASIAPSFTPTTGTTTQTTRTAATPAARAASPPPAARTTTPAASTPTWGVAAGSHASPIKVAAATTAGATRAGATASRRPGAPGTHVAGRIDPEEAVAKIALLSGYVNPSALRGGRAGGAGMDELEASVTREFLRRPSRIPPSLGGMGSRNAAKSPGKSR